MRLRLRQVLPVLLAISQTFVLDVPKILARPSTELSGWAPLPRTNVQIYRINPKTGRNMGLLDIRKTDRKGFFRFRPSRRFPTRLLWFAPPDRCSSGGPSASYSAVVLSPPTNDATVRVDFVDSTKDRRATSEYHAKKGRRSWSSFYPQASRWTDRTLGVEGKAFSLREGPLPFERILGELAGWRGGKAWDAGSVLAEDLTDGRLDGRKNLRPLVFCGQTTPALLGTTEWREAVWLEAGRQGFLEDPVRKQLLFRTITRFERLAPGPGRQWDFLPAMPTERDSVLVVGGPGVPPTVIGGETNQGISAAVERYDPDHRRWTALPSYPLGVAYASGVALPGGKIFVTGGFNSQGFTNRSFLFDPHVRKWVPVATAPVSRAASTAVLLPDSEILVTGGEDDKGLTARTDRYDLRKNRWIREKDAPLGRIGGVSAFLPDGRVWVGEGLVSTGGITGKGFFYDPESRRWSTAPAAPTPRLYPAEAVLPDGRVIVLDGLNRTGVLDTADLFDPVKNTWTLLGSRDRIRRKETGAALLGDGSLLLVGGEDASGNSVGTATRLH